MDTTKVLIHFDGVEKTYDGHNVIVRNLNLDIHQGEFLSLLGPSGSGKTTTLMMLAGFESPTAGEIYLSGKSITRIPPHKRNFGMVFQDYALFPHMTVSANIAYPLSVRKISAHDKASRIRRSLDMVKLSHLGDRYPFQLSGGQRQRVALARALVFDPQLVLMDEPLGALDKQLREHMQIELKELHQRLGVTFVYVTHDQSEALTMSNRVAVFQDGLIQQIDTVQALYEKPINKFVAGFVGDGAMLHARISSLDGQLCTLLLSNGTQVQGINVNQCKVNESVYCNIRPERLQIVENSGANTFEVRMVDVMYFGDHLRVRCEITPQEILTIKTPLTHAPLPYLGQNFKVYVPPEHLRVYR